MSAPTKAAREALAEIVGALCDAPLLPEALMGRAFDVLAGPIKDVAMAVAAGDREFIAEAHEDLKSARADVKGMGR